jgi:hypothetical protein
LKKEAIRLNRDAAHWCGLVVLPIRDWHDRQRGWNKRISNNEYRIMEKTEHRSVALSHLPLLGELRKYQTIVRQFPRSLARELRMKKLDPSVFALVSARNVDLGRAASIPQ